MIESDLIEIYKDNMFLLQKDNQELWFSLNKPLEKAFYTRKFTILTAWNPDNKPTNDEENARANEMLKADLKKYELLDSLGKYKDHQEKSFLVYDISLADALSLGSKYHQYSLFYNDTITLTYIECSSKKVLLSKKIRD